MRPYSAARRRRDADYRQAREAVYERAGGACEAGVASGCTGRCEQVHHLGGRVGEDVNRLDNLRGVCRQCHDRIHAEPAWAVEHGWLTSRHDEVRPPRWAS